VKALVEKNGIAPVLADWTDRNEMIKQRLTELNSQSIPLLAIYPANQPDEVIVLRDTITQGQLLEALEKAGPSASASPERHQVSSLKSPAESTSQ